MSTALFIVVFAATLSVGTFVGAWISAAAAERKYRMALAQTRQEARRYQSLYLRFGGRLRKLEELNRGSYGFDAPEIRELLLSPNEKITLGLEATRWKL